MQKKIQYKNRIELLPGTLDMLILQTLQWGPQHGYGISQSIGINSGEALRVETGSLYPALHRLERPGGGHSADHWQHTSRRDEPRVQTRLKPCEQNEGRAWRGFTIRPDICPHR
jgi:PadR family transcriptional regulator, regulatory protein PadR